MGLFLALGSSVPANAVEIDLQTITMRAKKNNYLVRENAERLYQSKMTLVKARTHLLPSLNIWDILNSVTGFEVNLIEDIAPFLIPANWFKLKENKLLHEAEKLGYRTLIANEVISARSIYWRLLHDLDLIDILSTHIDELDQLTEALRIREEIGVVPVGTTRDLQIRSLGIRDDWHQLRLLYRQELNQLTMALGFSADTPHSIRRTNELDVVERMPRVDYALGLQSSLAASPELAQFKYFIRVLPLIKGEVYFSILGAGKASRGLPGGGV
jgi:hypothetical protein